MISHIRYGKKYRKKKCGCFGDISFYLYQNILRPIDPNRKDDGVAATVSLNFLSGRDDRFRIKEGIVQMADKGIISSSYHITQLPALQLVVSSPLISSLLLFLPF